MGIDMDMCLTALVTLLALLGLLFLVFKTVEFIVLLHETFGEINSLRNDLKFLDKRHTETRDDYWKLHHEIAALKKVNGGP